MHCLTTDGRIEAQPERNGLKDDADKDSNGATTIDLRPDEIDEEDLGVEIIVGEPIGPPVLNVVQRYEHEIELVLAEFRSRKPALAEPATDAAIRVAAALVDIGRDMRAERVRIVSCGDLMRFAALLPEPTSGELSAALGKTFADVVGRAVTTTLGDALDEVYASALGEIIGAEADRALAETIWNEVICGYLMEQGGLEEGFAGIAWKSLHHVLRFQIGFTLAEMPSHRASAMAFLELFTGGNFPLGFMADGTFLVLTA